MTVRQGQLFVVGAVFALALLLRICQVLFGPPLESVLYSDMLGYLQIAEKIDDNIWEPRHFYQSVGFPLLVWYVKESIFEWGFALSLMHCGLSFASLVFLWRAAEESFGFKAGLVALIAAAVHVPWIYLTTYALPETAFTFLLSASAWTAGRIVKGTSPSPPLSLLWGALFIAAFWLKGTHVFWGPLFVAGLVAQWGRKAIAPAVALAIPVAAGLALHGALTYSKIGKLQLAASSGGINFAEGKCPEKRHFDSLGASTYSPLYVQLGLRQERRWGRPFTDSAYFFRQGLKCIAKNPFVLVQSLENIPYLFYGNVVWPLVDRPDAARIRLYELYFGLFLIAGLTIKARNSLHVFSFEEFAIWGLPVLALLICVYVFKAEARYRVPFDVWLIPLAAAGWTSLFNAPVRRSSHSASRDESSTPIPAAVDTAQVGQP